LIETTRQVSGGSAKYVEIKAASPPDVKMVWPFAADNPASKLGAVAKGGGWRLAQQNRKKHDAQGLTGRAEIERELETLRSQLEELSAARSPRDRALGMLRAAGIEGALAKELAHRPGAAARKSADSLKAWLMSRVSERLGIQKNPLAAHGSRLIACVGPTGVGKTTTLAKLCASARLDYQRTVSVITLDTYRVGAVEQWQRYAALLGVPFHVAYDAADFSALLAECRSELVLVDTAGRPSGNTAAPSMLEACLAAVEGRAVDVLLALPAWLRASDAERVVDLYAAPLPTSIVATKLDETRIVGGLLHAALPARLPFSFLCTGPRVPEDIKQASHEAVLDAVFSG
jgi:flagellar biosynthesis protein FlhF